MAKRRKAKGAKGAQARKQRVHVDKTVARLAHRIDELRKELKVIKKSLVLKKSRKKRR